MKSIFALGFFFAFLLLWTAWSEPSSATMPQDQAEQASSEGASPVPGVLSVSQVIMPHSQGKTQKVHKWTGSLVDTVCMADALRQVPSADQMLYPEPLAQYYLRMMGTSQKPPQGSGPGTPSTQGQAHSPGPPAESMGPNGDPETSERELAEQAAQLRRADLLDHQVKVCTPNRPTSHFGLIVSGGHLLKFDTAGDFKAKTALKASEIQPGKAVKAKVTGVIIEEGDTVAVASIEIRGQIQLSQGLFESSSFNSL